MTITEVTRIEFTKISNDINGNPRYVCHFLNLVNEQDEELSKRHEQSVKPFKFSISHLYDIAVNKAHKIGGRRFHNKQYGGGIVFTHSVLHNLESLVNEVKNS